MWKAAGFSQLSVPLPEPAISTQVQFDLDCVTDKNSEKIRVKQTYQAY